MRIAAKSNRNKGLNSESQKKLQHFFEKVKSGEIVPFKENIEKAKQNLIKAGLIK